LPGGIERTAVAGDRERICDGFGLIDGQYPAVQYRVERYAGRTEIVAAPRKDILHRNRWIIDMGIVLNAILRAAGLQPLLKPSADPARPFWTKPDMLYHDAKVALSFIAFGMIVPPSTLDRKE
jgi:hypothetical protein